MPISEHERQILQQLENSLLVTDSSGTPSSGGQSRWHLLVATAGLVAGALLTVLGLGLPGAVGTAVATISAAGFTAASCLFAYWSRPRIQTRLAARPKTSSRR